MLSSIGEGNAGRVSPSAFGEAIDDSDYRLELAHLPVKYSGLALPNSQSHEASRNDFCHLISALNDETTFETAKQTQTMAAKAAIRTTKDSLHEQELKRITAPIPGAAKRTTFSKPRNRQVAANPSKLRYVNGTCLSDMEFRCIETSIL